MMKNASDRDHTVKVPTGALFVAPDEPLLVFSSVLEAEQYLEAIDVDDGVYPAAFGPSGEPYSIHSDDGWVIIERTGEPEQPDELRRLLLHYLEATGRVADEAATLGALVADVWAVTGGSDYGS